MSPNVFPRQKKKSKEEGTKTQTIHETNVEEPSSVTDGGKTKT